MRVQARIQKWGNSLALRLTGPLKAIPEFKANMLVDVEVTEEGLQIHPVITRKRKKLPFTEAELIKSLTPKKAHVDILANLSDKELEG